MGVVGSREQVDVTVLVTRGGVHVGLIGGSPGEVRLSSVRLAAAGWTCAHVATIPDQWVWCPHHDVPANVRAARMDIAAWPEVWFAWLARDESWLAWRALEAGATGVVWDDEPTEVLVALVDSPQGTLRLPPNLTATDRQLLRELSPMEWSLVRLIARGSTNEGAAERLSYSSRHLTRIRRGLMRLWDCDDSADLRRWCRLLVSTPSAGTTEWHDEDPVLR